MDDHATTTDSMKSLDQTRFASRMPPVRSASNQWRLTRWLAFGLSSGVLAGCGTIVPVMGGDVVRPGPGPTLTLIPVTFTNNKCVLDLNLDLIPTNSGQIHYWSLVAGTVSVPERVTFDSNGIDISQTFPPFLHDFIDPQFQGNTYQWTANPKFTTGVPRSYDVHATWTKADGTKVACVSTDPYIVNRGTSANQ